MNNKRLVYCTTLFITIIATNLTMADDLEANKDALAVISDFADKLCNKIPLTRSSDSLDLSGEAKVEVNKLIKKLADLNIENQRGQARHISSHRI